MDTTAQLAAAALAGDETAELRLRELALDDDAAADAYFGVVRALAEADARAGRGPGEPAVTALADQVAATVRDLRSAPHPPDAPPDAVRGR